MIHKLLLSCLAVIGLMALPQSASTQEVVYACKNPSNGVLILYANTTTCQQGWTLVTLNVTGPQGPPGPAGPQGAPGARGPAGTNGTALAASQFGCGLPIQSLSNNTPMVFTTSNAAFGNSIITTGSSFSSFYLSQTGVYVIEVDVDLAYPHSPPSVLDGIQLYVNGTPHYTNPGIATPLGVPEHLLITRAIFQRHTNVHM